jgi:tRNA(Ile)-lysidine synthase
MRKLQDLPPEWARFCLGIQSFMEKMLDGSIQGKSFLVAFSGGPDSLALLRVLDFIRPRTGISISAVHLNHMLRPEADADERFAEQVCLELEIPLKSGRSRVESFARVKNTGFENAGRTIRYRFIRALAAAQKTDYILTGHQLNDLAEDMLMRLCRGTGWPGLSGMTGYDPLRRLIRPLLLTPRKTVLDFLDNIGQEYVLDASNEDRSFLRNKIRMDLIPVLEEISPGFLKSVTGLWKLGGIDREHWQGVLDDVLTGLDDDRYIPVRTLEQLSRAARLRLYKKMLDRMGPGQALLEVLLELDELWFRGQGGREVWFPGDKFARIVKKGVLFGIRDP